MQNTQGSFDKFKKFVADYLKDKKEAYQKNIQWYNAELVYLDFDSNDFMMYDLMRKMEIAHLYTVNEILDFINGKEN